MRYGGMYIPDSIAAQVLSGPQNQTSGSQAARITKIGATEAPPATTQPAGTDATTTILWIGAATSLAGFAIETARYLGERKTRKA